MNITGNTINHRLDLVLYLEDTVSGELITTAQVEFFRDGKPQQAVRKEAGIYAFLNLGAVGFILTVRAAGYCERQLPVPDDLYAKAVPLLWVSMVPGKAYPQKNLLHMITGTLEGIESVCGIACSGWQMRIRGFEKKTNTMKLFNPHGRYLYPVDYGIMNQEKKTFELISVAEQISQESIRIAAPLSREFADNSPVERVIVGMVRDEKYLLLLRQDVETYLVRWTVKGREYYRELNMNKDAWDSIA